MALKGKFLIQSCLWIIEEVHSKGLRVFHPVGQLKGSGRLCFLGWCLQIEIVGRSWQPPAKPWWSRKAQVQRLHLQGMNQRAKDNCWLSAWKEQQRGVEWGNKVFVGHTESLETCTSWPLSFLIEMPDGAVVLSPSRMDSGGCGCSWWSYQRSSWSETCPLRHEKQLLSEKCWEPSERLLSPSFLFNSAFLI